MKIETSQKHTRYLNFTELTGKGAEVSELEVSINYTGEGNASKGVTLDKVIVPCILRGLNEPIAAGPWHGTESLKWRYVVRENHNDQFVVHKEIMEDNVQSFSDGNYFPFDVGSPYSVSVGHLCTVGRTEALKRAFKKMVVRDQADEELYLS